MSVTNPEQQIAKFATLFRGGKIATDDPDSNMGFRPWENPQGGFYPADGDALQHACKGHLAERDSPIGVYPLVLDEDTDTYMVYWGCVDWDDGEEESHIHALNTQEVLRQTGVISWVERSRSKGYHLWVFFQEAIPARKVREGLIAVCNVVDAPTREVNPKQIELTGKGWGNGVRLPYPCGHPEGRNVIVGEKGELSLNTFVGLAHDTRIPAEQWDAVHALYRPPRRTAPPERPLLSLSGSQLTGLAGAIRHGGPRSTAEKVDGDRSATLYALACAMFRQGYASGDVLTELESADRDWGGKFAMRIDGRKRLWETVQKARTHAWEQPKEGNS